jgi:hypothetical protein
VLSVKCETLPAAQGHGLPAAKPTARGNGVAGNGSRGAAYL